MRRIAANKIATDSQTIKTNMVIEVDNDNCVISIEPLSAQKVEPALTKFFNGLITTYVSPNNWQHVDIPVTELITDALTKGYSGKLLLWQNVSLSHFKIRKDTKVTIL